MLKVLYRVGIVLLLSVVSVLAIVVIALLGGISFATTYVVGLLMQGRGDSSWSLALVPLLFLLFGWGSGELFAHCQRDERLFVGTALLALALGSLAGFACTELPKLIVCLMAAALVLGVWGAVVPAPRRPETKEGK